MRGNLLGNHVYMTDQERVKLLEYKVAVLGTQVEALASALGQSLGEGLNKPIPHGLVRAIREVSNLGMSDAGFQKIADVARSGFSMREPRTVADLPDVIDFD